MATCQRGREKFGATIWDAGLAVPDLCVTCSRAMLAATTESVGLTETISSSAELVLAKESLGRVFRVVPDGHARSDRVCACVSCPLAITWALINQRGSGVRICARSESSGTTTRLARGLRILSSEVRLRWTRRGSVGSRTAVGP